jgi:hypothetical protein
MTMLIATIGQTFAFVSSDTATQGGYDPAAKSEMCRAADWKSAQAALANTGERPDPEILGYTSKLAILPHLQAVAVVSGPMIALLAVGTLRHSRVGAADSTGAAQQLGALLREARDTAGVDNFTCVLAGYSRRLDQGVGYVFASDSGFQRLTIKPGQHLMQPCPDEDDEAFPLITADWNPAAQGRGTAAFHVNVARAVYRTYQAGRYPGTPCLGGELHTARIERDFINVQISRPFLEEAEHEVAPSEATSEAPMRYVTAGELLRRSLGN